MIQEIKRLRPVTEEAESTEFGSKDQVIELMGKEILEIYRELRPEAQEAVHRAIKSTYDFEKSKGRLRSQQRNK